MNNYRLWDKINSMYVDTKDVVMSLDGSHIWWNIGNSGEWSMKAIEKTIS